MAADPTSLKDDEVALLVPQGNFESSVPIMSVLVIRLFQDICVDEVKLLQGFKQVQVGAFVIRLLTQFIKLFVEILDQGEIRGLVDVLKK